MNPLVRAARNAVAGVCASTSGWNVTRRMGLVVLLSAALVSNASAMTSRSSRLRPRTVAQEQPTHNKSAKKSARPHEAARTHAKGAANSASAKKHGRRHHAEPIPADDPMPMKRARHGAKATRPARVEMAAERKPLHRVERRAASRTEPEIADAMPAHAATTAEFMRAGSAGNTQGVSHPEEMNEDLPVAVGTALRPQRANAVVSAATPMPAASAHRVDGFGAEGVTPDSGRRTLAKTMAAHRAEMAANVPHLSGEERNEITDEVVKPEVLQAVYTRGGRLVMPAPLKGSHEVLVHQNLMADSEGLSRIQNDAQLEEMVEAHELARLPETSALHLNPELPENRRYARPWTAKFAADTARAFAARFGEPIQVNSAVRTVEVQLHLMRVNGNAANIDGDTASPHLTGQAIDIGKRGMSKAQLAWMRDYLLPLMQAGKIDVEEEFQQACFHISVYRNYLPAAQRRMQVAQIARRTPAGETYAPPVDGDVQ